MNSVSGGEVDTRADGLYVVSLRAAAVCVGEVPPVVVFESQIRAQIFFETSLLCHVHLMPCVHLLAPLA